MRMNFQPKCKCSHFPPGKTRLFALRIFCCKVLNFSVANEMQMWLSGFWESSDGFTQCLFFWQKWGMKNGGKKRKFASFRRAGLKANINSLLRNQRIFRVAGWKKLEPRSTPSRFGEFFIFPGERRNSTVGVFLCIHESARNKNYYCIDRGAAASLIVRADVVCLEKTESTSREWDMLIQSARRWINKFPPREPELHRRICIIKKRGVFRLIRMHLHLNARRAGKHERARRDESHQARLHNFEYFSPCHFYGKRQIWSTHALHLQDMRVDTAMKNKARASNEFAIDLLYA
jgi:hypothetical protein